MNVDFTVLIGYRVEKEEEEAWGQRARRGPFLAVGFGSIRRAGGLLSGSTCGLFPCTLGLLPAGDPGPFR